MTDMATATNRHASLNADKAAALLEAYRDEGFVVQKDGQEKVSSIGLAERVRDYLVQKANVQDKGEVQTTAVEPADLTMSIFQDVSNPTSPDWPDDDDDSDEAEIKRHIWTRVMGAVSKAAQAGRKGSVQRLLAADPQTSKLIVCTTKIGAKPRKAIYVSADRDSILLGLAMPRTTKLATLSSEIADDFRYAIERNEALRKALNERMETGLKAARDTARAKLALTSGSENQES